MISCDFLNALVHALIAWSQKVLVFREQWGVNWHATCRALFRMTSGSNNAPLALCYFLMVRHQYSDDRLRKLEPCFPLSAHHRMIGGCNQWLALWNIQLLWLVLVLHVWITSLLWYTRFPFRVRTWWAVHVLVLCEQLFEFRRILCKHLLYGQDVHSCTHSCVTRTRNGRWCWWRSISFLICIFHEMHQKSIKVYPKSS